jgi:two-component system, OmpR family, phosphate regulon sensor histidine kinase PhoR
MGQNRIWIYAAILFLLVGTILATQVSWILQSAKIEESFLNQRVNMALCSAMDVLSKDRGLCSNVESCVSHGQGRFEISFNAEEKEKIDSVIQHHLWFYNIHVPFQTTLSPYIGNSSSRPLPSDQALLFPAKAGMKNVLVQIEIPSKPQLIRAQINGTVILSGIVLVLLIGVFINTLMGLMKERKIRKETVDFINTMAHDLKTPISNIAFATSLLTRDSQKNTAFQNQYISIIDDEIKKLKERARKILGAASVDAVLEDASDKTEIDIHELIEQSVDSFSLRLQEMNGEVTKQLRAGKSIVRGSKLQLASAIMNIIDNAITYSSRSSSHIQIRTKNDLGGISIEIQDNGPGIPASEQELVFKKAYRIRNNNKLPEGFGLGLYLSKILVEKHGGKLSLSSDGATGSRFVIQLPLS